MSDYLLLALWTLVPLLALWLVTMLALLFITVLRKRTVDGSRFLRQSLIAIPIAAGLFIVLMLVVVANSKL